MKQTCSALLGGAFLLAATSGAFAQSMPSIPAGVYLRGDVGGAFGADTDFKDTSPSAANATLGTSTEPSTVGNNVIFGGGVGYRFTPMFRSDLTLDYLPSTDVSGHNSVVTTATSKANVSSLIGMINGYLDINGFAPAMFGRFQPYLQAGVGFARNDLDTTSIGGTFGPFVLSGTLSGHTDTSFAWGVGAGAGYALTPNLTLDVGYKYLDLGDMRTGNFVSGPGGSGTFTALKADLHVHTVTVGLRYAFGAPPAPPPAPVAAPPAPPPAAVAPAKQMFIVFFEFDKSSLTPDGAKVVDAAAAAFKSGKSNVAIAGYTDLAGTQQYNLALSKRRADTVKAALVSDGVPAAAVEENWYGKQNPRVPTADGVREPQNRRVEITM